MYNSISDVQF